ncbi:hypothetical protein evm_006229 [Chilo suppressalis]|nr:hypothetical protein evm_006229 [Chilo suppressalis]
MDCLVGYGSDDETERYGAGQSSVGGTRSRREDDTNYEEVNMDMSEESQESEPELPQAEPAPSSHSSREDHRGSDDGRDRDRRRRDRRRESPQRARGDRERRDERYGRTDRSDRGRGLGSGGEGSSRRGLLGDRPDDRHADNKQVPALMDLKPFGGEPPPGIDSRRSQDARDAVSPRFVDRDRRDRDRNDRDRDRNDRDSRSDRDRNDRDRGERERNDRDNRSERDRDNRSERDRDRHNRRSEEKRLYGDRHERRDRSRSRGAAFPPPSTSSSSDRRGSPSSGDYRPSSYKVNKKLEVMEKMGLQIKTPDGSMATAQQLRAAAGEPALPSYSATAPAAAKLLHQLQKRKLLWSNKGKTEAEEVAKWSGARFAQDSDGKQACKFMRLMGIKDPAAVKTEAPAADPIKKQEELFQAMQAQYDVARATTHTMRGVGLGFQRGQF